MNMNSTSTESPNPVLLDTSSTNTIPTDHLSKPLDARFLSSSSSTSSSPVVFTFYAFYVALGIILIGNMCLYFFLCANSTTPRNRRAGRGASNENSGSNLGNTHNMSYINGGSPRTPRHNPQSTSTSPGTDNSGNGINNTRERRHDVLSERLRKEIRSACAGSIRSIFTFIVFEWTFQSVYYIQYLLEETIFFKGCKHIIRLYFMYFYDSPDKRNNNEKFEPNIQKRTETQGQDNRKDSYANGNKRDSNKNFSGCGPSEMGSQQTKSLENKIYDNLKFGHDILIDSIGKIWEGLGRNEEDNENDKTTPIEQIDSNHSKDQYMLSLPFGMLNGNDNKENVHKSEGKTSLHTERNEFVFEPKAEQENHLSFLSFFQNKDDQSEEIKSTNGDDTVKLLKDSDVKSYITTSSSSPHFESCFDNRAPSKEDYVNFKTTKIKENDRFLGVNTNSNKTNLVEYRQLLRNNTHTGLEKDISMLIASILHWCLCYAFILMMSSIYVDVFYNRMTLSRSLYNHYRKMIFFVHVTSILLICYFVTHILYEHLQLCIVGLGLLLYGLSIANKGQIRNGNILTFLISQYLWTSLSDWELTFRIGNIRIEMDLRL